MSFGMNAIRFVVFTSLLIALPIAACGGKVVFDEPSGTGGAGQGTGGAAPAECPGFERWCSEYIEKCQHLSSDHCAQAICDGGSSKALQCMDDLPSDATCQDFAVCGGD